MRPARLPGIAFGLAMLTTPPAPDLLAATCEGISPASETPLTTVQVASGLLRPVLVAAPPGDPSRVFILQQDGLVLLVKDGATASTIFLDVKSLTRSPAGDGGNEEGLLGLAFHPDYASNGWFFIYHTNTIGSSNIVARYTRSAADPDIADPATRQMVMIIAHTSSTIHNGGMLAFGPDDGYLYIATGDGGTFCDMPDNAQNGSVNLGKLLRLDVDALPYSIPPDNPFVGPDGINDEIWALGLRNPWRLSFDRATSDLYIGDVGQSNREEIDYRPGSSPGGENYGWVKYEGSLCPSPTCDVPDCTVSGLVLPLLEYQHGAGVCAVTGGYVYRGCRMPSLHGTYFYADYCGDFIRSFKVVGGAVTNHLDRTLELAPGSGMSIRSITSFGEDARGEIHVVDQGGTQGGGTGEVFKIVPVLSNLEVSGAGAAPFLMEDPDWRWEDLQATSSHPIANYRVYRTAGNGSGTFECVHVGPAASWAGGDPLVPGPGGLFTYVVTALNPAGLETSPGSGSDGTARSLGASPCPP